MVSLFSEISVAPNSVFGEWINVKQLPKETINIFFIRVSRLSKQVVLNGYLPASNELREKFILGLTSRHFLDIQKRLDDLPLSWNVSYHELPTVAQAYLDNVIFL